MTDLAAGPGVGGGGDEVEDPGAPQHSAHQYVLCLTPHPESHGYISLSLSTFCWKDLKNLYQIHLKL